MRKRDTK